MTTVFRISLLLLLAGVFLGDIVVASIGLAGLCGGAVYVSILQDAEAPAPVESEFIA
ncbi:hypothetical protein [Pseudomonas xantholysinigenes]|uniref:Uncharacterized protein n=1 Tax=Pseudomonas xantholysinigenes TaxID=2745490 RepID=A0A9E6TUS2_9PSED|nr:hypothetical protein [Pseudomonas xantholysinigenes]QXI36563.1 hypothetical protein HU772_014505 [Pseudomonas xantholysinigenes]